MRAKFQISLQAAINKEGSGYGLVFQGLSYKACSAILCKFVSFGLFILVYNICHYTPAACCYATKQLCKKLFTKNKTTFQKN